MSSFTCPDCADGALEAKVREVDLELADGETAQIVGGVQMENKILEQRQTSWLPRVMKAAGLVTTKSYRSSPVRRHHGSPHRVWVRRAKP